jgi:hypothetical protein
VHRGARVATFFAVSLDTVFLRDDKERVFRVEIAISFTSVAEERHLYLSKTLAIVGTRFSAETE